MAKENEQTGQMHRSLKTRHLSMIALGGSIGTGLFIASGSAITSAGPGGALVAYTVMGIMVYFLMTSSGIGICFGMELLVELCHHGARRSYYSGISN